MTLIHPHPPLFAALSAALQVALAPDGSTLFLGSWDYYLYALDVATGCVKHTRAFVVDWLLVGCSRTKEAPPPTSPPTLRTFNARHLQRPQVEV